MGGQFVAAWTSMGFFGFLQGSLLWDFCSDVSGGHFVAGWMLIRLYQWLRLTMANWQILVVSLLLWYQTLKYSQRQSFFPPHFEVWWQLRRQNLVAADPANGDFLGARWGRFCDCRSRLDCLIWGWESTKQHNSWTWMVFSTRRLPGSSLVKIIQVLGIFRVTFCGRQNSHGRCRRSY